MKVTFAGDKVFDTFVNWIDDDKRIAKKIAALVKDIQRNPTDGIGKPEALKDDLAGHYSRRITGEHRLVYKIEADTIIITSCKGHYSD
jgi:toxin YoeB